MNKEDIIKKWSCFFENDSTSSISDDSTNSFPSSISNARNISNNSFPSLLPIAMKVAAHSLCQDYESEERILRRERLVKLELILGQEEIVELVGGEEEYKGIMTEKKDCGGLISVKPLSAPNPSLFYMDYKYGSDDEDNDEIIN